MTHFADRGVIPELTLLAWSPMACSFQISMGGSMSVEQTQRVLF